MKNLQQERLSKAEATALSGSGASENDITRGTVGTFIAVVVAHLLADFMGTSVWPVYKTLAGLDVAKAGWIATVIAMSGTALQPLFGSIADRFGPRRVILLGTLLPSFALLLGPLTDYQTTLDRMLPSLFGLSGFYLIVFIIWQPEGLGRICSTPREPDWREVSPRAAARHSWLYLLL